MIQGLLTSFLLPVKDSVQRKTHFIATSLRTNAVVVTRFFRKKNKQNKQKKKKKKKKKKNCNKSYVTSNRSPLIILHLIENHVVFDWFMKN